MRKNSRKQSNRDDAHQRGQSISLGIALVLAGLTALLLTLATSPIGQWYVAWFALTPWLLAVGHARTIGQAAFRGWMAGVVYFAATLWWMWPASAAGVIALIVYFGCFWALASVAIRGFALLSPLADAPQGSTARAREPSAALLLRGRGGFILTFRVLAIATVWVAAEWLRGNMPPVFPWLPLGTTQSPNVTMCQVADLGGPWIVSFWLVLPSALAAIVWTERKSPRSLLVVPSVTVAVLLAAVAIYGVVRLRTTNTTGGPRVMVIQSNFPHLPGGAPTVERKHVVEFFFSELDRALAAESVDLVVLPEASFPPLNEEARRALAGSPIGPYLEETHDRLRSIARQYETALLVGGNAVTGWTIRDGERIGSEIRNSVFYYDPWGDTETQRYDKIYLVGFAERAPFSSGPAWLHRAAMALAARRAAQPIHAGDLSDLRPFVLRYAANDAMLTETVRRGVDEFRAAELATARFIAPICLENIDPRIIARMIRDPQPPRQRVDFLANLSNDGWFTTAEKHQHLQSTIFRCIENRVPMVRSSNTGISGFVDSCGRMRGIVAANRDGISVQRIELDPRTTFYMQYGDLYAGTCIALVAIGAVWKLAQGWCRR